MNHTTFAISMLLAAGACQAQTAREPVMRVLVDTSLNAHLVDVFSIDSSGVTVIDEAGNQSVHPLDTIAALAPTHDWHDTRNDPTIMTRGGMSSRSGSITLTDGQRLIGAPSVISVDDEMVAWSGARLGLVRIPIENVQRIAMPRIMPTGKITPPLASELDDVIQLGNGDTLRGFIETIANETTIETDAGAVLQVETGNIDQIALANEQTTMTGPAVWLADGSVLCLQSFETEHTDEQTTFLGMLQNEPIASAQGEGTPSEADAQPYGLSFDAPLAEVVAIASNAHRLLPLSDLVHTSEFRQITIDLRGVPALGSRNITMPGPMRTTWVLPQSASRLALKATLPIEARAWGDLKLLVRVDENIVSTHAISAESPNASINIDVSGAELFSLEIDEAEFGPIQDRLVISEAILLLDD